MFKYFIAICIIALVVLTASSLLGEYIAFEHYIKDHNVHKFEPYKNN